MKQLLLLLSCLVFSTGALFAQNVGIGTATPQGKLDVNGPIVSSARNPTINSTLNNSEVLRAAGVSSDYIMSVQDGNGRIQHKWNATYGTGEQFIVGGENAWMWDVTVAADPYMEFKFGDGSLASTGGVIDWQSHIAVQTNGNVGINRTTVDARLHVYEMGEDIISAVPATIASWSSSNFSAPGSGSVSLAAPNTVNGAGADRMRMTFNAPESGLLTFTLNHEICWTNTSVLYPNYNVQASVNGGGFTTVAVITPCTSVGCATGNICAGCGAPSGETVEYQSTTINVVVPSAGLNTVEIRIPFLASECNIVRQSSFSGIEYNYSTTSTVDKTIARFEGNGNVCIGPDAFANNRTYKLFVVGNAGATAGFSTASDARFKTSVSGVQNALDKVLSLEGVSYQMRHNEYPDRNFRVGRQYGFLAQDVQKVLPEIVTEGEDGYLSLQYDQVVPVLVEAIKEQQTEIDALKAENAELKAKLQAHEERLQRLEQLLKD